MKDFWFSIGTVIRGLLLGLLLVLLRPVEVRATTEESFDVLQIGTRTYTNVTVTAKAKSYVFLMHAGGIINLKVSDLPPDLQTRLGYSSPAVKTNSATAGTAATTWVKQKASKLESPQLKQFEQSLRGNTCGTGAIHLNTKERYLLVAAGAVLFLFFAYCSRLICEKAGQTPGVMIWLPILQIFPLLKAAGMSPIWFLAYCVPLLNAVPQLVWAVKISKARGKSGWVAFWLIFPLTSLFAFLYLAFSEGAEKKQTGRPKLMSLATTAEFALGA